jgi:hypothetical protein
LEEFEGVYADLRRDFGWGNWVLLFFGVLGGGPRRYIEEGGHSCVFFVLLSEFEGCSLVFCRGVRGTSYLISRTTA